MKSPLSHRKLGALDWFCLRAIHFYQRHLSPRKGYRCAYARLYGGGGCSGFARDAIAQLGWHAARAPIRARFVECKLAGQTLRAQFELDKPSDLKQGEHDLTQSKKRSWHDRFGDACCVDLSWFMCADSLCDGSACEALSCADASCAHGALADAACADASCAEAACGCHSCF